MNQKSNLISSHLFLYSEFLYLHKPSLACLMWKGLSIECSGGRLVKYIVMYMNHGTFKNSTEERWKTALVENTNLSGANVYRELL